LISFKKRGLVKSLAFLTALRLLFTSCGIAPSNSNKAINLFASLSTERDSTAVIERFKQMHRILKHADSIKGENAKQFIESLKYLTSTELDSISRFLIQWNKALNDSLFSVRSYPLEKSDLKAALDQLREQDFMERIKLNNFFLNKIKKEQEKRKASRPPKESRILKKKTQFLARNKETKPSASKGFGFGKPRRIQHRV
jgi:hypothetical protein